MRVCSDLPHLLGPHEWNPLFSPSYGINGMVLFVYILVSFRCPMNICKGIFESLPLAYDRVHYRRTTTRSNASGDSLINRHGHFGWCRSTGGVASVSTRTKTKSPYRCRLHVSNCAHNERCANLFATPYDDNAHFRRQTNAHTRTNTARL